MSVEGYNKRDKSPYRGLDDEKSELLLRELIKKRGILKARLTKFVNYLSTCASDQPANLQIDLKLRIKGAVSLFNEFNSVQSKIEETVLDSHLEEQLIQREQFEDSYYSAQARAESLTNIQTVPTSSKGPGYNPNSFQSVRLPTITLPEFDGSYENWLEFRDTYLSLVHNSSELSHIQKFHYLKSSLKGSALLVINSLELTSDNYLVAWELLQSRYSNNRLLVQNHIKAIFHIQSLTKESHMLIRNLIDSTIKNLRALKLLGEPTDTWDTLIIYIIVSKLDKTTEREWEQHKGNLFTNNNDYNLTLKCLLDFLKGRADMLETLQASVTKYTLNENKKQINYNAYQRSHCNVSSNKAHDRPHSKIFKPCIMCKHNHPLYSCTKFIDANFNTKLKLIRDNKLCSNCLRSGHTLDQCRFGACKKCDQKHNTLIHPNHKSVHALSQCTDGSSTADHESPPATSRTAGPLSISHAHAQTSSIETKRNVSHSYALQPVLLSTALIEVADTNNKYHVARALLDSGSQRCFIKRSFCDLLGVQLIQSTHEIRGVGNSVTHSNQLCELTIKSRVNSFTAKLKCFVLPQITSKMSICNLTNNNFCIPDDIELADPYFLESQDIDILLGAEMFWDLLTQGKIRLPNGPYLHNTLLGWIISGSVHKSHYNHEHIQCNYTQTIDALLRQFWELEELPRRQGTQTDEDQACENHFVTTTTRNNDGRFCVSIPFKQSPEVLGDTFPQAERRFLALEKRLQRSETYKQMYTDFIHEYEGLGHMTKISSYGNPHYFMPHHGVLREASLTTKLRVVFDASTASSSGLSLNDIQRVGPPIQGDLLAILLRFRQHRYVACADVRMMYRQVQVLEQQRHLQLILWRDTPSEPLSVYRLNTVTYGTASAPFLSVRCLKQLGIETADPDVQRIIREDFFVDDMLTGDDDKSKLLYLCNETAKTLQSGCFPLRKWTFNFPHNDSVTRNDSLEYLSLNNKHSCKTLGIGWLNISDEFYFNTQYDFQNNNSEVITKRSILSHISQIFDPIGLISPSIMQAKIILQRLWLLKIDWNDAVPNDVIHVWNRFVSSLSILNEIRVPRYVLSDRYNCTRTELHIFTDASQLAYGACIYIRSICENDNVVVRLLCAKGKVAPLKPVSIPRLELCGALLGARLYEKVISSIHRKFDGIIFWSDSTIVLGWLRMSPNLLHTFVQNRVAEIHDVTGALPWRHVSGKQNPADLVSRGVTLDELANASLWWNGPDFLHDKYFISSEVCQLPDVSNEDLPETKRNCHLSFVATNTQLINFERFSNFMRLIRAMSYVLRFVHNVRNKTNRRSGNISVDEIVESQNLLAKISQVESFPHEYELFIKQNKLKTNHFLSKLNIFIDADKILRVGGRLSNSQLFSYNKRHPIVLSNNHYFTKLLFRYEHVKLLHAGPQALLFNIREAWWPVGGRNLARKVVHGCIICTRLRGKTLFPQMGNLPSERISPTYPFFKCGVDYAGPIFMLNHKGRGARKTKCYICLFVCFVTRAIHLELVTDLTSDSYLLALKRFIARRGKPHEIFSDNGRNFVGLMNDFAKFLSKCSSDIIEYASKEQIKFRFIVPYAAHFGGLWEAGVRSCKHHLRRVVGNAHLTYEELSTALAQIEAVLNSRPLSPMSADPNDYLPLSPGHFLIGRTLTAPACEDLNEANTLRLTRYQRVEQMRQHFWSRWMKEYISELQTRTKWKAAEDNLLPNTLVVIKDDNLPPLKWHLGRVVRLIPGRDNVTRVADIRTASGIIRRSCTKICPLFTPEDR